MNSIIQHSLPRPSDLIDLIGKDQENDSPPRGKLRVFKYIFKETVSKNELNESL